MYDSPCREQVYVRFTDIRDAEKAHVWINYGKNSWEAGFISPLECEVAANPNSGKYPDESIYEGQVLVIVAFFRPPSDFEIDLTGDTLNGLVTSYGTVMAFEVSPLEDLEVTYRMEFCDSRSAGRTMANLRDLSFDVSSHISSGYLQKANLRRTFP